MRLVATSIVALEVFFLKLKLSTLTGRAGGFCHAEATIKAGNIPALDGPRSFDQPQSVQALIFTLVFYSIATRISTISYLHHFSNSIIYG
jgi:hypothetical protein